jgi:type VI secretion system secreted protein Hcp
MRRKVLGVLAVLALGVGGAAVAFAATGSDSTTISACVAKNGKVSIYPPGQACLASEHAVTWNVQGPAGPPGPPGPAGSSDPGALTAGGMITITGQGFDNTPSAIIAVSHEIVSPRDPASGLPTGKRQHKPLTIRKEIDKATPLLMRAIFTNQTMPVVQLSLNGPDGKTEATVKLTNASVSDHVQQGSSEVVTFTYQKITWTWVDGGITAEDDWQAPTG